MISGASPEPVCVGGAPPPHSIQLRDTGGGGFYDPTVWSGEGGAGRRRAGSHKNQFLSAVVVKGFNDPTSAGFRGARTAATTPPPLPLFPVTTGHPHGQRAMARTATTTHPPPGRLQKSYLHLTCHRIHKPFPYAVILPV